MSEMTPDAATALRKPFPPESVGKLPKGGAMLDYVGHAAVTDRLLTVDPHWSWEPFALGPDGLPAPDREGNLWIRLTVCGVTRIGVGDGKNAKERIGDAIRNAAMRFGVALDLWAKENLVEFAQAAHSHQAPPREQQAAEQLAAPMHARTRGALFAAMGEFDVLASDDAQRAFLTDTLGRAVESRSSLTQEDAQRALRRLRAWKDGEERAVWEPEVSNA